MRSLEELLARLAGCATEEAHEAGTLLLREGDVEDAFYLVRRGDVALEAHAPQRGAIPIQTLHAGDLLGWSWLIAPYRTAFDGRALTPVEVVRYDAACVRDLIATDHALAHDLLSAFIAVIVGRLQATRLQLLDVYGAR